MRSAVVLSLALCACLAPKGVGTSEAKGTPLGDPPSAPESDADEVPQSAAELLAYLTARKYSSFPQDASVHATDSPHGIGGIRNFYRKNLVESLEAQNLEHPLGAAAIVELFAADETTRIGWAVSVKVAPESDGGFGWLWLEALDQQGAVLVDGGQGLGLCTGCHASGDDYVLGTAP